MEIERPRNSSPQLDQRVPSAPEFDQESLGNALDDMPERVERHQSRPSIWTRLRRTFSTRYESMEDEDEPIRPEQPPAYTSSNPVRLDNPMDGSVFSGDLRRRNSFLRKLYALFIGQMSLFTGLCALFYYVPHIRQMFRKTFADKVWLSSFGHSFTNY